MGLSTLILTSSCAPVCTLSRACRRMTHFSGTKIAATQPPLVGDQTGALVSFQMLGIEK
jgi:hypothetical protein